MDLSLKKSFKAQASFNSLRKISAALGVAAAADSSLDEEKFNLLGHREGGGSTVPMRAGDGSDRRDEIVLKVDGGESGNGTPKEGVRDPVGGGGGAENGGRIWRESSYDFWRNGDPEGGGNGGNGGGFDFGILEEDPPSKLIGQFLHKQKASGDFSLDMDLEMDELQRLHGLPPVAESPSVGQREARQRVSFEALRRQSKDTPSPDSRQQNGRDGEVLRCTSNASFKNSPNSRSLQRKSSLLASKTKSRLMDPPEQPNRKSCQVGRSGQMKSGQMKSGQMKSGFLGRLEDEEDDPLLGEDIPDEYRKEKLSVWILLEWVSLILIIASLVCNLAIKKLRDKKILGLQLWKWEVLVLVLICGRLVSGWVIRIIVFFIERNFLLRKRVLYFVYGLKKAVQNCLWLGLVLIAWHLLFDKNVKRQTRNKFLDYVTKILIALLVGVLLWLVKTLVIKVLASSFHVSTYFDRIQDSLFNQYVIETLSGSPLVELQRNEEEEERIVAEVQKLQNAGATVPPDLRASAFLSPRGTGRVIGSGRLQRSPRDRSGKLSRTLSRNGEDGITIDHLHKLNPGNVSAWNMKRLMNIVRHGALSTLDERILDSTEEDESATQIRSENEAKAAARKIFQNVARPGSKYICLEDLGRFLQDDEAWKTMGLFEGASESQKITKSALKSWVVNAFRERRALALSLNDTKTAVNKLHQMVNVVIGIIIAVITLLILGIATSKFLVFISSQLLLVAFIFGNTCKTIFEAIIFLFVMHPFDVGDRCEIEGVQMIVEEMNILTTVFLRYDNQKIIYPNSVLATKAISNYYRSPDMGDAVEFCVHISTPADKIAAIKQRIISYVDNKKDHWYPTPMIIVKDVEVLNRVRIAVWLTHRMNHQDMGERWTRRAYLLEEMVKIFKELDIQYRLLPLDINVCALPPVTSTRMPANWTSTN